MLLDLRLGVANTPLMKAWKFPGGEIHVKFSEEAINQLDEVENVYIISRIRNTEDLMFLLIVADTIRKDSNAAIRVYIPYFPYQQADRDFAIGECFSLQTVVKMIGAFDFEEIAVFDPHSDVTPALLKTITSSVTISNNDYIDFVLGSLLQLKNQGEEAIWKPEDHVTIVSPDAGAYKKIFKLGETIMWEGPIECANKFRPHDGGVPQVRLSTNDFGGRDILVIDDICIGGRTFVELAKQLVTKNVGNLYLAVSHGIFSNGYDELTKYYQYIFTTDSFKDEHDYNNEHVIVYNLFP